MYNNIQILFFYYSWPDKFGSIRGLESVWTSSIGEYSESTQNEPFRLNLQIKFFLQKTFLQNFLHFFQIFYNFYKIFYNSYKIFYNFYKIFTKFFTIFFTKKELKKDKPTMHKRM